MIFKLLLTLILGPIICLIAVMAVCALIATGFETLLKFLILVAAFCFVRWVFAVCKRGAS